MDPSTVGGFDISRTQTVGLMDKMKAGKMGGMMGKMTRRGGGTTEQEQPQSPGQQPDGLDALGLGTLTGHLANAR